MQANGTEQRRGQDLILYLGSFSFCSLQSCFNLLQHCQPSHNFPLILMLRWRICAGVIRVLRSW